MRDESDGSIASGDVYVLTGLAGGLVEGVVGEIAWVAAAAGKVDGQGREPNLVSDVVPDAGGVSGSMDEDDVNSVHNMSVWA